MNKKYFRNNFVFFTLVLLFSLMSNSLALNKSAKGNEYPTIKGYEIAPRNNFPLVLLDDYAKFVTTREYPKSIITNEKNIEKDSSEVRVNSDTTTELQNEMQIAVNPLNPMNLAACWRDFRLGYRQIGVGYSFDGGVTWTDSLIVEPKYDRQSDPGMNVDKDGNFYLIVLSYSDNAPTNGLFVFKSTDGGVTWAEPYPAIDNVSGVFEDKELMACDRTSNASAGNLYVTWTRFYTFTSKILFTRSPNGQEWEEPIIISDENNVQWPVPVVGAEGEVYVAWINMNNGYIMLDRSFDWGATFGSDITVVETKFGGDNTLNGNIWVFNFPALDADITESLYKGNLYMAYMDYADENSTDTDIFFIRSLDQGLTWSEPIRVNDDELDNGADQFHPWISINEEGVISLIWLDRRNDSENNLLYDCYLTRSYDGGLSFEPNVRISSISSDPTYAKAGLIGEYIGLASSSSMVYPMWTDIRNFNQDAYFRYGLSFGNQPPNSPTLLTPENNSLLQPGSITFSWVNNGDPDNDMVGSWLYVLGPWGQTISYEMGSEGFLVGEKISYTLQLYSLQEWVWTVYIYDPNHNSDPYYNYQKPFWNFTINSE